MRAIRAASSTAPTGPSSRLLRVIAAIGLAVGLLQIPTPSVALDPADRDPVAGTTGTLAGSGGYPRVIRLAHAGAADGTIIETDTDAFTGGTQRFHRSTDGGSTFEPLSLAQHHRRDPRHRPVRAAGRCGRAARGNAPVRRCREPERHVPRRIR